MPLKKITIRVDEDDFGRIQACFPNLSYNEIIRLLMRSFVQRLDKPLDATTTKPFDEEVEL